MRDISPGTGKSPDTQVSDPSTRRVTDPTRARTGSDKSAQYPSGTRIVDERGSTLIYTWYT